MNYKLFGIILLLIASVFISACSSNDESGKFDGFATCLTEKNAIMYGTEWCSHCQNQKKMFGNSFEYVNFVDCDANRAACTAAGVEGYPTWSINGKLYPGVQSFYELSTLTGCALE